jgi:hypothetical protein
MLRGPLAFDPSFTGEFYGSLPDGGPDLSNLDCRISDGTDLGQLCSPEPLDSDGGVTTSHEILDIYVTSVSGESLSEGVAEVDLAYAEDGGVFATIDLTYLFSDGGWDFERALSGQVTYRATALGMSGHFQAFFPGYEDGGGILNGRFGAEHCGSLSGY